MLYELVKLNHTDVTFVQESHSAMFWAMAAETVSVGVGGFYSLIL